MCLAPIETGLIYNDFGFNFISILYLTFILILVGKKFLHYKFFCIENWAQLQEYCFEERKKKQALYSPIPIFTTGVPNNDQKKYEIKRTITNRFYFYCPIQIIKTYIQKIALNVVYEFKRSYSKVLISIVTDSYAFSILLA